MKPNGEQVTESSLESQNRAAEHVKMSTDKQEENGEEKSVQIMEKFNPGVDQFVPSEDTCYEISVHPDLLPFIIGSNGSNLSRLSSKFGVRFVFPASETNSNYWIEKLDYSLLFLVALAGKMKRILPFWASDPTLMRPSTTWTIRYPR